MIRISGLRLRIGQDEIKLWERAAKLLRINEKEIKSLKIVKKSLDARKKPELFYNYTVDVDTDDEARILKRGITNVTMVSDIVYRFPETKTPPTLRPVVIGMGPAGLFCGYYLAKAGFSPLLLERGKDVDQRQKDVEGFWMGGNLDPESNVQFGEGGAGTFSDGKLGTLVNDKYGRNGEVLRLLTEFGAPAKILYDSKPHIGTDILKQVVKNMRFKILELGGEVRFESRVTGLFMEGERLTGVQINGKETFFTDTAVLAVGHSARDTFSMLYENHIPMEAKPFAVGFRVAHKQERINLSQYGEGYPSLLPAAAYKVAGKTKDGRGVYSFCMCPGGYVVDASSEPGRLCVNGMSYSGRSGDNANSAIVVTVEPKDYGGEHPLSGITFQRRLEENAYRAAKGRIPAQTYESFLSCLAGQVKDFDAGSSFVPAIKGSYAHADLTGIFPDYINQGIVDGMTQFGKKIVGFDSGDTWLLGAECRTSSPVRVLRDETLQSEIKGLYPCGEGAGYAGGITSAAMDGIRIAEMIAGKAIDADKKVK